MADTETVSPHRERRPRLKSSAALAVVVIVAAACGGADGGADDVIRLSAESNDLAPSAEAMEVGESPGITGDLTYTTFDRDTRSLAEFLGRPLVINFFASWCGPCIAEMPDLEQVYQEVKAEVAFLGLAQDEDAADALGLIERTGISYETGWDPELDVYSEFGSFSMPTTVFVTADGQIAEVFPGALTADAIREKVDALEG